MPDFRFKYEFQNRAQTWSESYIFTGLTSANPDDQVAMARAIAAERLNLVAATAAAPKNAATPNIYSVTISNLAGRRQSATVPLRLYGRWVLADAEVASTQAAKIAIYSDGKLHRSILRLAGLPAAMVLADPYQPVKQLEGAAIKTRINAFLRALQGPRLNPQIRGTWAFRSPVWGPAPGGSAITDAKWVGGRPFLVLTVPGTTLTFPSKIKIKGLRGPSYTGVVNGICWATSVEPTTSAITTNIEECRFCGDEVSSYGIIQVPGDPNRLLPITESFFYGYTQRRLGSSAGVALAKGRRAPCCP